MDEAEPAHGILREQEAGGKAGEFCEIVHARRGACMVKSSLGQPGALKGGDGDAQQSERGRPLP